MYVLKCSCYFFVLLAIGIAFMLQFLEPSLYFFLFSPSLSLSLLSSVALLSLVGSEVNRLYTLVLVATGRASLYTRYFMPWDDGMNTVDQTGT